jgi:PEP-CTERM/exosortase A-associated glycosyltransferase
VYEVRALWEDGAVDHGTARRGGWRYMVSRGLETWLLRKVDAITTICEGLRKEIVGRSVDPAKVSVIPNGVDPVRFRSDGTRRADLAHRLGLENSRVVGFIGSFYGYEGINVLLDALPAMLARMPNIRLLLVGGGPEENRLKRQAAAMNIADKVIFAGRIAHDQVPDYYKLVDIFVYPRVSTRVTELVTPLKPLEAMAEGRVVVVSDVGGHRELVRNGETGCMFRPGDASSLAETVIALLLAPDRAAALRLRALRFVATERTWTASVGRYAAVYSSLLEHRRLGVAH